MFDRIAAHAKEARKLYDKGVLSVRDNEVHVDDELFRKLSKGHKRSKRVRDSIEFPYEEYFTHEGLMYFRLVEVKEAARIARKNIKEDVKDVG